MNKDELKALFEDLMVRAHQSGKQETSELVRDLTDKITGAVKEEVVRTVNGKIDGIKVHLENQDEKLEEMSKKLDYLRPISQAITFTKILKKGIVYFSPLAVVGTILIAVWRYVSKL